MGYLTNRQIQLLFYQMPTLQTATHVICARTETCRHNVSPTEGFVFIKLQHTFSLSLALPLCSSFVEF